MKTAAVILAAGQGKRMQSDVAKQYLLLREKPVLFYSLSAFEQSEVDEIILVVGKGEEEYCRNEIVERYRIKKVKAIVQGGKERYHSVAAGLRACDSCEVVLIHDGARPFVDGQMIRNAVFGARQYGACIVGMPVKDTIKLASADGMIESTPNRESLWAVQTPQAFRYDLIVLAYGKLLERESELAAEGIRITDDAMTVEYFTKQKVKIVEGSYRNIKITTPEDLRTAEVFLDEACTTQNETCE